MVTTRRSAIVLTAGALALCLVACGEASEPNPTYSNAPASGMTYQLLPDRPNDVMLIVVVGIGDKIASTRVVTESDSEVTVEVMVAREVSSVAKPAIAAYLTPTVTLAAPLGERTLRDTQVGMLATSLDAPMLTLTPDQRGPA